MGGAEGDSSTGFPPNTPKGDLDGAVDGELRADLSAGAGESASESGFGWLKSPGAGGLIEEANAGAKGAGLPKAEIGAGFPNDEFSEVQGNGDGDVIGGFPKAAVLGNGFFSSAAELKGPEEGFCKELNVPSVVLLLKTFFGASCFSSACDLSS